MAWFNRRGCFRLAVARFCIAYLDALNTSWYSRINFALEDHGNCARSIVEAFSIIEFVRMSFRHNFCDRNHWLLGQLHCAHSIHWRSTSVDVTYLFNVQHPRSVLTSTCSDPVNDVQQDLQKRQEPIQTTALGPKLSTSGWVIPKTLASQFSCDTCRVVACV